MWIKDNIQSSPQATVTYFVPDSKKVGGKYITATVNIVRIDEIDNAIVTEGGTKIAVHNILDIAI